MIAKTASQRLESVARRRDVIVGTNMYANAKEEAIDQTLPDYAAIQRERSREVENYRTSGWTETHASVMSKLNILIESKPSHALDAAVEAVLGGATLGRDLPDHNGRGRRSSIRHQESGYTGCPKATNVCANSAPPVSWRPGGRR